jgi:hypothetical protein
MLNKWWVYEFLKQTYMATGTVPSQKEINTEFASELAPDEIVEGILEFEMTVGKEHFSCTA